MTLRTTVMMAPLLALSTIVHADGQTEGAIDRTILPIPDPVYAPITEVDARRATMPPAQRVEAPDGAPNVVIVLVDDLGFGTTTTFGGPIRTPTLQRLADQGLRYNNFHTTALCAPTRAALKSGRNHHTANMGSITELSTSFPGQTGQVPNTVAPVAEVLRLNGYNTAAFGKWHETAAWETSPSGPFDRWPTHQGFEKFYGFLGGETNQYAPMVFDGVKRIEPSEGKPEYHFTEDMTDQAIAWVRTQQSLTPDKPFFIYFATGAVHAPHQVQPEWSAKYKGEFDKGWDAIREETIARQIELGVVPEGTELAPVPDYVKRWDELSADERRLFARQAEVYAGFMEHTDHHIGRLVDAIDGLGALDNTLFFYIAGDNGTSAEGLTNGTYNENTMFNDVEESIEDLLPKLDEWGTESTYAHMAAGWAVAFDTPFAWTKQVASDFGGTRNGTVVHWPNGFEVEGGLRTQFHHVIDVAPTILDAAKLPEPKLVHGVEQLPIAGVSMRYSFADAEAPTQHQTQYFEMFGNRAIYHEGWFARVIHKEPWSSQPRRTLQDEGGWELYNVHEDFSLTNDLAAQQPERLTELKALFLSEAARYHALPIDDRSIERFNPAVAGRPDLMGDRTSITLYEGMEGMLENTFMNVKNRSKTITAHVSIPEGGVDGMLLTQGGRFGGWALYVEDNKPAYTYNWLGLNKTTIASDTPLPPGEHTIVFEFEYAGDGLGDGGKGTLKVNGESVASGDIAETTPNTFSMDESADVGVDLGTPVVESIGVGEASRFEGEIEKIVLEVQPTGGE